MTDSADEKLNSGSLWHRWDPHIHAPGTLHNNQFKGPDAWERYLDAIEQAQPPIRAIGVTDYYGTGLYERVCDEKAKGRLGTCDLIFLNIEMRLAIGTVKGHWVNVHLMVSPEDPTHLVEINRFLSRLSFRAYGDSFQCTPADLANLGRRHDPSVTDERAALQIGSEQFKVSFDQLRTAFDESEWAQANVKIAVAGGETDGTSGVRDAADATFRQEVEKFAHIVFASSAAQREFWCGERNLTPEQMQARYGGLKPCLHGCDAHDHVSVGAPFGDRFSWVKGEPTFDSLRQACIDPKWRAFVGPSSPISGTPSQTIAAIEVHNAEWLRTKKLALNSGLVAIVGARGSGKTALADIIAHGCDATAEHLSPASFLTRAHSLLGSASVAVNWIQGDAVQRRLAENLREWEGDPPRVRYLSQKFVEELCSAHGITDKLILEIERVIFEAHPVITRDGTNSFAELLDLRANRPRAARVRDEESLVQICERIGDELDKHKLIAEVTRQVADKKRAIDGYTTDRAKLVSKGSEARAARLVELSAAVDKVRGYLRHFSAQEQSLLVLQDEVQSYRTFKAPEDLRRAQDRNKQSRIEDWSLFLTDYTGDVNAAVTKGLTAARIGAQTWRGVAPTPLADENTSYLIEGAPLDQIRLAVLDAEVARLEKLINVDKVTSAKFAELTRRIAAETILLEQLTEKLTDCKGAMERVEKLRADRSAAYIRVFESIVAEEGVLAELYAPLMERLAASSGTLKRLSFSVKRTADITTWAKEGEKLLDLRQTGPFKGQGTLAGIAHELLQASWESGSPAAVDAAMNEFRNIHQDDLLNRSLVPKSDKANYRVWAMRFARWLFGTDHIALRYSIDYDGVDIRKLSPGTRGIVLLLLYLALDDGDDRPLIIDQPEENLDPKSIFDELVPLFFDAKQKRQVIIVTHNANLVINTDADQIIVANAGPHQVGELPPISYVSGGLETAAMRKTVCDILEGGEEAFKARARRLRVRLQR